MKQSSPNAHTMRYINRLAWAEKYIDSQSIVTYIHKCLLTRRFSHCLILPKKISVRWAKVILDRLKQNSCWHLHSGKESTSWSTLRNPTSRNKYTPCPEKRTDSILAVTLTNLDNFSYYFALVILTIRVTKIVKKNSHQYFHDTT